MESFPLYLVQSLAVHIGVGMLTPQGVPLVILLVTSFPALFIVMTSLFAEHDQSLDLKHLHSWKVFLWVQESFAHVTAANMGPCEVAP